MLYKYRSAQPRTLEIFESARLWFSPPSSFNDPFDCNLSEVRDHTDEDAANFLSQILEGKPDRDRLMVKPAPTAEIVRIMTAAKAAAIERTGVLSLSRNFDNILMWSHYADEHKGLVIEFDLAADPDFFVAPINVDYCEAYTPTNYLRNERESVDRIIRTKSEGWKYEQEVRVMKHGVTGHVNIKPRAIRRVIFGCRVEDKFVENVRNACSRGGLAHVRFAKMKVAYARFALELEELA